MWTPGKANGWWPKIWTDGDRIFVAFGVWETNLAELKLVGDELVTVRQAVVMDRSYGQDWIGPDGQLTIWKPLDDDHAERWLIQDVRADWTPVLTADDPGMVAGNTHLVDFGHWASHLMTARNPGRIVVDGQVVDAGHGGGAPAFSWPFVGCATNNEHTNYQIWSAGRPWKTFTPQVPLFMAALGARGRCVYGGYGRIMGIDSDDAMAWQNPHLDLTVTPWAWEGQPVLFDHDGGTYLHTVSYNPDSGQGYILIRPWGEKSNVWTLEFPAVHASVVAYQGRWLVACCGDTGQAAVLNQVIAGNQGPIPIPAVPPMPAAVVNPLDRPIWFGYYYATGRYGDFRPAQVGAVTGLGMYADGSGAVPEGAVAAVQAALTDAGAGFVGAGDIGAVAGMWGRVAGILLGEADTTEAFAAQAGEVHRAMDTLKLPWRPVIATLKAGQVIGKPAGVDWLALEIYLPPPGPWDWRKAQRDVAALVADWVPKLPADMPLVLIAQSYDRNHLWKQPDSLAMIQPAVFEAARANHRVVGIFPFAYARPGGVRDFPAVEQWHRAMVSAIPGRPEIITVRPAPVPVPDPVPVPTPDPVPTPTPDPTPDPTPNPDPVPVPVPGQGLPEYQDFLNVEGPAVDRAYTKANGHPPGPANVRHYAWQRLVNGHSQAEVLDEARIGPHTGEPRERPDRGGRGREG